MNPFARIQALLTAKAEAALDAVEDPREALEYAYNRQRDLHRQMRQGLVEVATARRQLETQLQQLRARLPELEEQAKRALAHQREDLARMALQRKQTCLAEIGPLEKQLAETVAEEQKLMQAEQNFARNLEAFRTRRETMGARYSAAQAQVQLNEALSGLSGEYAEVGRSLERAEDKINRLQSRATALDTLLEGGTSAGLLTGGTLMLDDALERDLRDLTAQRAVEMELAALKAPPSQA